MAGVIILSGPIGAGKTTVAKDLAALWSDPLAYIEGDVFWPFLVRPAPGDRRGSFAALIRSMTAASAPLARSGYDVLLDFSIPPGFLPTARRILKDVPLDFVMLKPPLAVCAARAVTRPVGVIATYDNGFYALFDAEERHTVAGENDPGATAAAILAGLTAGRFRMASSIGRDEAG